MPFVLLGGGEQKNGLFEAISFVEKFWQNTHQGIQMFTNHTSYKTHIYNHIVLQQNKHSLNLSKLTNLIQGDLLLFTYQHL